LVLFNTTVQTTAGITGWLLAGLEKMWEETDIAFFTAVISAFA
jgi:hypothetical protein